MLVVVAVANAHPLCQPKQTLAIASSFYFGSGPLDIIQSGTISVSHHHHPRSG
jgi:hypothetical protein